MRGKAGRGVIEGMVQNPDAHLRQDEEIVVDQGVREHEPKGVRLTAGGQRAFDGYLKADGYELVEGK